MNREPERGVGADRQTDLTYPTADRLFIVLGIPALALLLGLALPVLARRLLDLLGGFPMRFVVKLLGSVDSPREIVVNAVVWLVIGAVVAHEAWGDEVRATLTDTELRLVQDRHPLTIARADVRTAFLDGKQLVVLDRGTAELFRGTPQAGPIQLAKAFQKHGFPWQDGDPYAHLYRPWTVGTADLPPAVNALLAARAAALKRKAAAEAQDLARSVQTLGFAVRDQGDQQTWRPLVRG